MKLKQGFEGGEKSESEVFYENQRNLSDDIVEKWLEPENLETKNKISAEGFEIVESIDGRVDKNVEISHVRITSEGQYPQHIHRKSDAYFIVTNVIGEVYYLSGKKKTLIKNGDRIEIPRGTPHGFDTTPGAILEFISIQSPPITDEETGEHDFEIVQNLINRI